LTQRLAELIFIELATSSGYQIRDELLDTGDILADGDRSGEDAGTLHQCGFDFREFDPKSPELNLPIGPPQKL
jgi:hypothetical protein